MHQEKIHRDPRSFLERSWVSRISARTWSRWEVCIKWWNQNIFDTNRIGGSLSISLETLDHWEIVLTSAKRCLHSTVYTKNLENDNSGHALLESPGTAPIIEFFLQLVAMEWFLVEFIIIQRKSINEDACKDLWLNGATRCLQIFGENLRRMAFTNLFYFVADRSFTADGGLL